MSWIETAEVLLAMALIVTGVAMLSTAAAFIAAGALLLAGAIWPARRP